MGVGSKKVSPICSNIFCNSPCHASSPSKCSDMSTKSGIDQSTSETGRLYLQTVRLNGKHTIRCLRLYCTCFTGYQANIWQCRMGKFHHETYMNAYPSTGSFVYKRSGCPNSPLLYRELKHTSRRSLVDQRNELNRIHYDFPFSPFPLGTDIALSCLACS